MRCKSAFARPCMFKIVHSCCTFLFQNSKLFLSPHCWPETKLSSQKMYKSAQQDFSNQCIKSFKMRKYLPYPANFLKINPCKKNRSTCWQLLVLMFEHKNRVRTISSFRPSCSSLVRAFSSQYTVILKLVCILYLLALHLLNLLFGLEYFLTQIDCIHFYDSKRNLLSEAEIIRK